MGEMLQNVFNMYLMFCARMLYSAKGIIRRTGKAQKGNIYTVGYTRENAMGPETLPQAHNSYWVQERFRTPFHRWVVR